MRTPRPLLLSFALTVPIITSTPIMADIETMLTFVLHQKEMFEYKCVCDSAIAVSVCVGVSWFQYGASVNGGACRM
jgi:hypothetical protein